MTETTTDIPTNRARIIYVILGIIGVLVIGAMIIPASRLYVVEAVKLLLGLVPSVALPLK